MPDHIHLFASPRDETVSLESWARYWKSQFSKRHKNPNHRWQVGYWDTTLRSNESYDEKWNYVRNNPIRHGLVSRPEDGRIRAKYLCWSGNLWVHLEGHAPARPKIF